MSVAEQAQFVGRRFRFGSHRGRIGHDVETTPVFDVPTLRRPQGLRVALAQLARTRVGVLRGVEPDGALARIERENRGSNRAAVRTGAQTLHGSTVLVEAHRCVSLG